MTPGRDQQKNVCTNKNGGSLPSIALWLLAGVCLLQIQPDLQLPLWTAAELVMLLPLVLWLFYRLPHRRNLLAFLLGYLWALLFAHNYLMHRLAESYVGQDILLQGIVRGLPETADRSVRFNFQVTAYLSGVSRSEARHLPARLRLSWYYHNQPIHSGDHWRLRVRLKPPHGTRNAGGFDYEKWLYQASIHATGYVRKSPDNRLLDRGSGSLFDALRERLMRLITELPATHYPALLQALTIGHKADIEADQWQLLRDTGTSHLMAISGLHIGLVAGLVFFVSRRLLPAGLLKYISAPQLAAFLSLLAAAFYALLAGFSVPTQRALIMLLVIMLAVMLRRPAFSLNTLSLALIGVLLLSPVSVLSAGFWLSFAAVFIIVLVSSARLQGEQSRLARYGQGIRIQWLIALGMLPLSLLLFQQGSLISPLANMLVIPLISFLVVPLALIASALSGLSTELASSLLMLSGDLLAYIWQLLQWLGSHAWGRWGLPQIPAVQGMLALLGVALLLMPRGFPLRYGGLILLMPMLLYQAPKPAEGEFWVTVLDVGQGLSVLLQTRDRSLLYDTGARYSKRFDTGERIIVPYLQYRGVQRLDRLLISHADNDHAGGTRGLLKHIPVSRLLGEATVISRYRGDVRQAAVCESGQHWQWNQVNFEILHPPAADAGPGYRKQNNRSCVLRVWTPGFSLLLPGDIEAKVERHLLKLPPRSLAADVLLVPHHGSNTSSSRRWLARVQPRLALISAGYKNRFRHPTDRVLRRYQALGSQWLNTASSGAIQIKSEAFSEAGGVRLSQQRKQDVHYWSHRF